MRGPCFTFRHGGTMTYCADSIISVTPRRVPIGGPPMRSDWCAPRAVPTADGVRAVNTAVRSSSPLNREELPAGGTRCARSASSGGGRRESPVTSLTSRFGAQLVARSPRCLPLPHEVGEGARASARAGGGAWNAEMRFVPGCPSRARAGSGEDEPRHWFSPELGFAPQSIMGTGINSYTSTAKLPLPSLRNG